MEEVAVVVCRNQEMHADDDEFLIIKKSRYHVMRLVCGNLIWKNPSPEFVYQFLTGTHLQHYTLRKGLCVNCQEIEEQSDAYLKGLV